MKKKITLLALSMFAVILFAFVPKNTWQNPWKVPDAAKNKTNPLKGDAASVAVGKTLYTTHCKSCHGTNGKKLSRSCIRRQCRPAGPCTSRLARAR